jgi:hypothetical protein
MENGICIKANKCSISFPSASYIIRVLTFVARGWLGVCAHCALRMQSALSHKVQSLEFYFYKWVYIFCLDSHMQLARNIIAMAKNSSGRLTKKYNQQVRHWRAIKCLMSSPTPPQVPFDKKKSGALLRAHNSWSGYINILSWCCGGGGSRWQTRRLICGHHIFSFSLSRPFCGLKSNRGVSTKQSIYKAGWCFFLSFLSVSYVLWS